MALPRRAVGRAVNVRFVWSCNCGRSGSFESVTVALDRADRHSRRHPRHVVRVMAVRPEGWRGRDDVIARLAQ